jgi:hypothetical protein
MERKVTSGKSALAVTMMALMAFAFLGTVMEGTASAKAISGITLVNKTGGPLTNLKHMISDDTKSRFYSGTFENGKKLYGFANYDEWVFIWGTDASGKEIQFCAEEKMSDGATVELYGPHKVKIYY